MKLFIRLLYPLLFLGIGWILGSKYQAPPIIMDTADQLILATSDKIKEALSERETIVKEILADNIPIADIEKQFDTTIKKDPVEDTVSIATKPGGVAPAPISKEEEILEANGLSPFVRLCKMKKISNAPGINSHGHVSNYKQLTDVAGVTLAMMPVREACISSGFGRRNGKLHKGYDYYSKKKDVIFAAGDGQIVEAEYRKDYGFTVLINHGNEYFTRYAHLEKFSKGVVVGAAVPRGFALGPMGQTAGFKIPQHLHFELLYGDYNTPKKSFGLKAVDIYSF